jgi:hypothetical protein
MIVHRGRGGLIALIVFLCFLAAEAYTRFRYRDDTYYQTHPWPKLIACLVAAALVWWLSPRDAPAASTGQPPPIEPETSSFKLNLFRKTDSLFFIPVEYWPYLLCLLGIVLYFIPGANLP